MNTTIREAPERPISRAFGTVFPNPDQMARLSPAERRLALLLANEARREIPDLELPRIAEPEKDDVPIGQVRAADVDLGKTERDEAIGVDLARLLDGRMLVQGASGAGKSWTLRRLIEQTVGRVQQIIVDPEGEFRSISETYGHLHVEAHKLDTAALSVLGARVRAHRISVLLDMSELDREGQMQAIARSSKPSSTHRAHTGTRALSLWTRRICSRLSVASRVLRPQCGDPPLAPWST